MQEEEIHSDGTGSASSVTKRKSMRLSSAKKALKKLFRLQPSPADGSCLPANSIADQLHTASREGTSKQGNRNTSPAHQAHNNEPEQHYNGNQAHEFTASGSQIKTPNDSGTNPPTAVSPSAPSPDNSVVQSHTAAMNALQPHQQQARPRVKLPGAPIKPEQEEKENVYPDQSTEADLLQFENLNIRPTAKDSLTPEEQLAELMKDPVIAAQRAEHMRFMGEALDMARLALRINETPVGCVLVHKGQVIARGMNATNVTRNGTRHAEFMAICALLSHAPKGKTPTTRLKPKSITDKEAIDFRTDRENREREAAEAEAEATDRESITEQEPEAHQDTISEVCSYDGSPHEGNEDGRKSHLYPYGQKLLDVDRVDQAIIQESILYVTVEPCIMCASLLRQLGIKKVYFGAVNDKFGGTGGVFSVHANSLPVSDDGPTASAHPIPKPIQLPDGTGGSLGVSFPPGGGDGGNVENGYEIEGGWGRDEAVGLLRRFYVQENGRAPVPRKKEGRAARLAAMMEKDGDDGGDVAEKGEPDSVGEDSRPGTADNSEKDYN